MFGDFTTVIIRSHDEMNAFSLRTILIFFPIPIVAWISLIYISVFAHLGLFEFAHRLASFVLLELILYLRICLLHVHLQDLSFVDLLFDEFLSVS